MNVQPELVGGRTDAAPLTQKGQAQARALGRRLRDSGVKLDEAYSSTAERARRTAQLALEEAGFDPGLLREESREILELCQGEWTGLRRSEVYSPAVLDQICREQLFFRPPGVSEQDAPPAGCAPAGESQWDVEERVCSFVERLLERPPAEQQGEGSQEPVIAIFSHGIAIRCFLRRVLGAQPAFVVHSQTENTAVSEVLYRPGSGNLDGWIVVRMNDAAHLEGLAA